MCVAAPNSFVFEDFVDILVEALCNYFANTH
jgi:hypothetical protein